MNKFKNFSDFNFEVIDVTLQGTPVLTINLNGLTFNQKLVENMGYPSFVRPLIVAENKVFAIQACKMGTDKAIKFSKPQKEQTTRVAYANSSDPNATMGGGGAGGGGGGMQAGVAGEDAVAEPLSVSVLQVGDVSSTDGTVAAPTTTTVSNDNIVNLVVEDFQQLSYTDPETGKTIPYNLYLPEGYDASKTYPLVFFVGDASANSNIITAPLTQGNGATVWATDESQAKQEAIVLVSCQS